MFTNLENLKNAINYTITSKELQRNKHGKCYKYIIELQRNNKKENFCFTDSIYNYEHDMAFNILDLIACLLLDMHAYDDYNNIDEFAWAFGYNMDDIENINQTKKAYNAYHDNSKKMHDLFTNKELNMLDGLFCEY